MGRNVTVKVPEVGSITFQVLEEMGFETTNETRISQKNVGLAYISTQETGFVPGCTINSNEIVFTGVVECVASQPSNEIDNWRLGLAQNVTGYNREAWYENGYKIYEDMQFGPPIRDGDISELPFAGNGIDNNFVNNRADLAPFNEDDPGWMMPSQVTWGNSTSDLIDGVVQNFFASWMMLARINNPRMIVLLGRVNWMANFNFEKSGNTLKFVPDNGGYIEVQSVTTHLDYVYDKDTIPNDLGDGYEVPDLRSKVSGNDERQGFLINLDGDGAELNKWIYDDDDDAIKWVDLSANANSTNWLKL